MKSLTRRASRLVSALFKVRPQVRLLEERITPDTTAHNLAVSNFYQSWNTTTLIAAADDWSGVPSIVGYSGDDTFGEGVNPQAVLTPYSIADVIANKGNTTSLTTGGVAEFNALANPVVALQGDDTADAPNLVISINTSGRSNISISYNLVDIDGTADDAVQPVALQYRIGNTGNFINLPAGFVADATTGPNLATQLTPVSVTLPVGVNDKSLVQLRIITTNAVGNDEWVGVDEIAIGCQEFAVNAYTTDNQSRVSVAIDADGDAIVVWASSKQDGGFDGIYGQRYNAAGAKVGGEFQVNTFKMPVVSYAPQVAMDASGDAIVVWSYNPNGGGSDIRAQLFNESGMKIGSEFQVNSDLSDDYYDVQPAVAIDANGNALVVWSSDIIEGGSVGIVGQRLNSVGGKVGGEFLINTFTTGDQLDPAVAMDADGDAVVIWSSRDGQDGSKSGIFGQRLNPVGSKVGVEFQVNSYTTLNQIFPSVAVDAEGDAFVVWHSAEQDGDSYGVYGQRFTAAGAKVGGEFRINTDTFGSQRDPQVAVDDDNNALVVWDGSRAFGGEVFGQRFDPSGQKVGGEFLVNGTGPSSTFAGSPAVAIDADGDAFVAWRGEDQNGNADVYGQRFASPNLDALPHNLAAGPFFQNWSNASLIAQNNQWAGVPSVIGFLGDDVFSAGVDPQTVLTPYSSRSVFANQSSNTAISIGGVAEFDGLTDRVVALQGSGTAAAPNLVIYLNTVGQNNVAISYNLRDIDSSADDAAQPVALQYRIGNTGNFVNIPGGFVADATTGPNLATKVTPVYAKLPGFACNQPLVQVRIITTNAVGEDEWVGVDDILIRSEFAVNATGDGNERAPSVATDDDGDALVVWHTTYEPGIDAFGVYGQRYNANGAKVGGEFLINTPQLSAQLNASVAMDADGDAVVVWQSQGQDGSGYGIFGQRFDAAGAPVGGEFQINTFTTGTQRNPSVAVDDDGDFMVVWNSQGSPEHVFGQRFDSAGAKVGGEIQISTYAFSSSLNPSVSMDDDGDAMVVWHRGDPNVLGIYGQRFDAAGAKVGGEFQINTTTADQRINAAVALDADGDALVVWQAIQDGDLYGIYGQRFNSAGAKVGGEFQINTYTTSFQINPAVALDVDGDAVVTWESIGQDGSAYGVYGQRFNSAGAKIGGEFPVNIHSTSNQRSSAVAMDADGDAMVVWHSYVGGGVGYEVYGQRFDAPELPATVSNLIVNHTAPGAQRSMVTSLQVTFDSKVSFSSDPAAAFSLVNQKTSIAVTLSAAVDVSGKVVTLTFIGGSVDLGGSLSDGRYTLTIQASQFAGIGFDGNADGVDGDNYVLIGDPATNKLYRLFGDADGSGQVTSSDFLAFRLAFLSNSTTFDYNGSGTVDSNEFLQFRLRFLQSV